MVGGSGFFILSLIRLGEGVTALIAVESGGNATYIDTFPYASAMPVIVAGENFDVLSAKMVLSICSMLHDCRFV